MKTLTQAELQGFLAHAAITAAGPERGIGRELSSRQPARRTVVIHFGADDPADYITRVVSILLSMEDSWVLVGRYGSAAQLGALTTTIEAEALMFDSSERESLAAYLCTRDTKLDSRSADIYLVGPDGNVIVTWDHHTHDEGLCVDLRDVQRSSALLAELNALGTELEVFYTD